MNIKGMRQIQLSEDLCHRAEQLFAHQFPDIETCLTFVLENLVNDQSRQMDRSEQQMVEQRLRDLGYV